MLIMENHREREGCFVYTRDQLLELQRSVPCSGMQYHIFKELLRLYRRCRPKQRRFYKPFILSIIMGSVRSLGNKMNELRTLIRSQGWSGMQCALFHWDMAAWGYVRLEWFHPLLLEGEGRQESWNERINVDWMHYLRKTDGVDLNVYCEGVPLLSKH